MSRSDLRFHTHWKCPSSFSHDREKPKCQEVQSVCAEEALSVNRVTIYECSGSGVGISQPTVIVKWEQQSIYSNRSCLPPSASLSSQPLCSLLSLWSLIRPLRPQQSLVTIMVITRVLMVQLVLWRDPTAVVTTASASMAMSGVDTRSMEVSFKMSMVRISNNVVPKLNILPLLGKKYCYGSMEGQYCHCDYCKCKHGYGSKGYGKCH